MVCHWLCQCIFNEHQQVVMTLNNGLDQLANTFVLVKSTLAPIASHWQEKHWHCQWHPNHLFKMILNMH